MMVEARQDADKGTVADNAADLSCFAEATARLFAEQTAAMAAMTVFGIRAASEMASMMLGALRGHAPETVAPSKAGRETAPATAKVVPLRKQAPDPAAVPLAVEPLATLPAKKPAAKARKASTPKASRAAAASKKPAAAKAAPASTAATAERDDLKKISGIGPRLEQVLNERGVTRYADLAAMSKASLKRLDGEFGLEGRIARDDWAGQARALAGGRG